MNFAMDTSSRAEISLGTERLLPAVEQFLQLLQAGDSHGTTSFRGIGARSIVMAAIGGVVLGSIAYLGYSSVGGSAGSGREAPSQAKLALIDKKPEREERSLRPELHSPSENAKANDPAGEEEAEKPSEDDSLPPLKGLSGKRRRWLSLARRTGGIERHGGLYRRLLVRGWRRLSAGEYRKASVAFSRAIRLKPQHKDAYYGLALALFEQKLEDAALSVITRAQKHAGAGADIWLLAGSAYQFLGHEKMARKMYEQYLKKEPRGKFARDVRIILAYDHLPALYE